MNTMSGPEQLSKYEDHWPTEMGGWFPGERVVIRGKDLFHELNELPWMGLLLFGITGRFFSDNQIRLFEGIWSLSTSYPDPRLWNNRVAALAGTARSTTALGIGAATAVSEATVYGPRPGLKAFDFLLRTKNHIENGGDVTQWVKKELTQHRSIGGYGRPITQIDERVQPLLNLATELGLANGPYTELAFVVERALQEDRWRIRMNIAALIAALVADQGLSPREFYSFVVLCFSAGMFPCYADTGNRPEGSFFPLRCSRIAYEGQPRRPWDSTKQKQAK
jgi:hypothetical protein